MKKKFLLFLLAIVAGVGTLFAESGECGENLTWDLTDGVLTISGNGEMYVFYSESDVPWYSQRESITSVIIQDGVTETGYHVFEGCTSLTTVDIPNSVTEIGSHAFDGCTSLTTINLPNSVTSIRDAAFANCSSLTSITIPNGVTGISNGVCEGCTSLASVTIPYGVKFIGSSAFRGCSSLSSISIPSSVISIENSFNGCNSLTSVSINAARLVASEDARLRGKFGEQVQEYILGESITYINGRAFEGCKHSSLKIGKNVSEIDEMYMNYMRNVNLTNIEIAEGNATFDSRNNCNAIIKTATNTLMFGCKGTIIPYGVTTIGENAFGGALNTIIIPESVTRIEDYAFSYGSIRHISIPNNMMTISGVAFYLSSIDSITWNAKYATISGDYNHLKDSRLSTLIVGENVEHLPGFFFECDGLKSVVWRAKELEMRRTDVFGNSDAYSLPRTINKITFGDKVEVIPQKLCHWTEIETVVIPNSVKTIKAGAFESCNCLKTVVLGDGITTLEYVDNGFDDYGVFTASNNITSFTCYATTPPTMKEYIQSNIVYVPATSVNAYKSANYLKTHTILPIGATPVETDEIHVTPSENYADIVWKAIANAASYELYIEFMGNTWRFVFDAEGILTSMTNHAPARYDAPQGTQSAGFSYTVMGLASGTTYNVTITAKAANGSTLNTETTSFTTTGEPQGIEDVNVNNTLSKKIIRDGNVYILRGEKVFTLQGQEVK